MWITLEQISCLKALSEEGSVSAASQKLGKAKSAVHYSLKKLEEQVGFTLLETGGYRGRLTSKGVQLLVKAQPILASVDKLKGQVHQIASGSELRLRMSTTALFPIRQLNRRILQVQKSFPQTEIVLDREIMSGERLLREGLVDIAIFENFEKPIGLEAKRIGRVRLPLVISKKHPFLQLSRKKQTREALFQYPQVIQRSTLETNDQHGVYKNTKQWTVNDLESKKQIILDGLAWGRLPEHEIQSAIQKNRVEVLQHIEKPIELDMVIARLPQAQHGSVSELLWGMQWG